MATYISARRLRIALEALGSSRAKLTPLFDFLIVKRTLAIKGQSSAAIVETDPAFIQALDEIGGLGTFEGKPIRPETPYLNFFALRDEKSGFRLARYRSNGTNSTISGTTWTPVIHLSGDSPRKASLAPDYIKNLPALTLTKTKTRPLPNLHEAAIWYHRNQDVASFIRTADTDADKIQKLTDRFVSRVGLTPQEIAAVFDSTLNIATTEPVFVAHVPSPEEYLPGTSEVGTAAQGSAPDTGVWVDLVVALAAKNFVILTGPSGTGKSRVALKMVESLSRHGVEQSGKIFELVPVGPDWTSPKRLLGYRTPFGAERTGDDGAKTFESYELTDTLRLILRAHHPDSADIPHFLIFDEMNLSHVERYFAPFLSLMEATNILGRNASLALIEDGDFRTLSDLLQLHEPDTAEAEAAKLLLGEGRSLTLPPNLFFIGTVNVDETTYMFSPKVLDRAHVIELSAVKPSHYVSGQDPSAMVMLSSPKALGLLQTGIRNREASTDQSGNPAGALDDLKSKGFSEQEIGTVREFLLKGMDGCYELLSPVGFPFGYRVLKEVVEFLVTWVDAQLELGATKDIVLANWIRGLDLAVLQKVLPKIHGNKRVLGDSLKALSAFLDGGYSGSNPAAKYTLGVGRNVEIPQQDRLVFGANQARLEKSRKKLDSMQNRLNSTGYVSFVS